ncbi:MAG: hypothetical protein EPO21_20915 [Chloroflexota bacterium]|nr:MAG: hypothetical protein EPO21_20915 [Chloroflexota bacterium]
MFVVAVGGLAIVGFLGIVIALNAHMSGQYTGAGLSLLASVVAFGLIGCAQLIRQRPGRRTDPRM